MEERIKNDLKNAQLNKDETAVSTLRLLLSEVNNLRIQKGGELSDPDIVSVIQKELKKRKEAASGFRQGNREESALKEESEAKVLEGYLPEQISDEELTKIISESINNLGATSIQDMGRVIGQVLGKVGQGADGSRVSALVKQQLSQ